MAALPWLARLYERMVAVEMRTFLAIPGPGTFVEVWMDGDEPRIVPIAPEDMSTVGSEPLRWLVSGKAAPGSPPRRVIGGLFSEVAPAIKRRWLGQADGQEVMAKPKLGRSSVPGKQAEEARTAPSRSVTRSTPD